MLGIAARDSSSAAAPASVARLDWPAARSGAGISAAAPITSRNAKHWTTMPSASPGIGSPKTRMPPEIAVTLAAALVSVMTGTASPFWRPRAEAKNARTEASTQVMGQGDTRPPTPPVRRRPR